jgi:hypothetical protein
MHLTMFRSPSVNGATLSKMFNGTEFLNDVVEDEIREEPGIPVADWKINGHTAIPAGTYNLSLQNSSRFGADTLTVDGVDGFEYIRIHGGNTAWDTEGCLLPGTRNSDCTVAHSQDALHALRNLVVPRLQAGEQVTLEIVNPGEQV